MKNFTNPGLASSSLSFEEPGPGLLRKLLLPFSARPRSLGRSLVTTAKQNMDVEERRICLNGFYHRVKKQILQYQSGSIGLFSLHTSGSTEESHIRDNLYCAMAVWALGLAYRHLDDSEGRTYELQQSSVKCMRGILFCYMRQADKVELFKRNRLAHNSLHVRFNRNTGDAMYDDREIGHLQIDVVALYLLTLVQMTASGLQIIYTGDEVNFVQNLVYYIERAYRTPDYGMWERGSKANIGHKELNASSIGMAKAALEAINGFNVFGWQGTSSSVIYVDPDAHNRNNTILHSLLPVASSSKVTDASLLTITGFPAFAIDHEGLRQKTRDMVTKKLEGKYGVKRFPRDGYKCVLEDRNRRFYEKRELELFDGIECEWPFFFLYLALDGFFRNDLEMADEYITKLRDGLLLSTSDSNDLIPHYYYVPKTYIDAEKKEPHSQVRLPSDEPDVFLWGQSLLVIVELLAGGLLDVNEIDPIGRHLFHRAESQGYINYRYASFKVVESDLVLQLSLISENKSLQATLATFGIETQTPQEIEPIQLWPPAQLIKAYELLGVNRKLGLTGRPPRPIGVLGTSKIYRIMGKTVVTYPILMEGVDFYMALDMSLMIDQIKTDLYLVRNSWNMRGRPTICLLLKDHHIRGRHFKEMLELLASFKSGVCGGVRVRLGKLQTLVSTASIDHLDFLQPHCNASRFVEIGQLDLETAAVAEKPPQARSDEQSRKLSRSIFTSMDQPALPAETDDDEGGHVATKSREGLVAALADDPGSSLEMLILQELLNREGKSFSLQGVTVLERIDTVYRRAGYDKHWGVVRRGAGLLHKTVDSLAPGITTILVSGKVVTIGVFGHAEKVIYEPLTPSMIQNIIYSFCMPHDPREAVLQQEMVLYLSSYIVTMPEAFEGMLKIRVGWIIQAMKQRLASCDAKLGSLYVQSPSSVKSLLKIVLTSKGKLHGHDLAPRTPLQKRQLDGAVHRVPPGFYDKVWTILSKSQGGIRVSDHHLPQLPTLSDMTREERNFLLKVEELLSDISQPEYRQIVVELLMVLATIIERNPEVELTHCIDLDTIVQEAIELFGHDCGGHKYKIKEQFVNASPDGVGGTATYLAKAVVNRLLQGEVTVASHCHVS